MESMSKLAKIISVLLIISVQCLNAQNLNDQFDSGAYNYQENIDSIVSIKYMINEYADDEPDLNFSYSDKDISMHSFERTTAIYKSKNSMEISTVHKFLGFKESMQLTFNNLGKPIELEFKKVNGEMYNKSRVFEYDEKGRLVSQISKGYSKRKYLSGDKSIRVDSTFYDPTKNESLIIIGDDTKFDDKGRKIEETTRKGVIKYEYDELGNVSQEILLDPYTSELIEVTIHKIFFSK